jgi:hypothetical protein
MNVSVSIGVATYPRDGITPEEILLAADRACFVAKRTGPGLIATADEGLAIARDFAFKSPTPIDTMGSDDDAVDDVRSAGLVVPAVVPALVAKAPARRKPKRPADASTVS